ncbi:hypothetical protein B0H63DRAFT_486272 [Podospora didyma]|uniref:Uncharacterized protein n=1 Tax=Podospora didyma TaxID=330526 RepID=A0AAE0K4T4_9PEZI|nr:hypothetical protein B0H63DRAFT_486272 [Podospora didyma]
MLIIKRESWCPGFYDMARRGVWVFLFSFSFFNDLRMGPNDGMNMTHIYKQGTRMGGQKTLGESRVFFFGLGTQLVFYFAVFTSPATRIFFVRWWYDTLSV